MENIRALRQLFGETSDRSWQPIIITSLPSIPPHAAAAARSWPEEHGPFWIHESIRSGLQTTMAPLRINKSHIGALPSSSELWRPDSGSGSCCWMADGHVPKLLCTNGNVSIVSNLCNSIIVRPTASFGCPPASLNSTPSSSFFAQRNVQHD